MSTSTDLLAEKVTAAYRRYGNQLLPGAAETLGSMGRSLGQLGPAALAVKVAELLEGPAARYINPEWQAPTLPDGRPVSPLRAVLLRHAGDLKPGAVDALVGEWGAELSGVLPAKLAGLIVEKLATRDVAERWSKNPPETPREERRMAAIVQQYFPMASDTTKAIVRDMAQDLRGQRMAPVEVVKAVAVRLSIPAVAAKHGVEPLPTDDWRRTLHHTQVEEPAGFAPEAPAVPHGVSF